MTDETYYCPECGHEFVQGEWNYNYDTANLDFECPECGWYGTHMDLDNHNDDETDDWDDDYNHDELITT
jgi:DNA-directed RNA polymerase subunit RPC12/RpoP